MAISKHNSLHFEKEGIYYSLFFFIFITFFIFQSKTINTGDAGELVTASYGLGVAHPSGYPIYLQIAKLFTFLPFGNIPMKVTLVSSLFSTLLIITSVFFLKKNECTFKEQLFFVFTILSCYSFFGQTFVAKFYPLNTFLIFMIFYLGYKSLFEYDVKNQLIISFLFGIGAGLHQTIYFMFIPLILIIVLHLKNFIKHFIYSLLFFLLGFLNVFYIILRSLKPTLLNMSVSLDINSLIYTLLRKAYGKSSSVDVISSIGHSTSHRLFLAMKNISILLYREFHLIFVIFFILGMLYLLIKNKRLFLYLFLTFLSYSVLLAFFTFTNEKLDIDTLYIVGHQYFLPAFMFYAIICTFGFKLIINILPDKLKLTHLLVLIIPLIYFPQHLFVNFFDKNEVAYYKAIDLFYTKPIKSIAIFSGDNDVFQGWYLKNVEKFRDDICLLSTPTVSSDIWDINNGCNYYIYKDFYPKIHKTSEIFNLANVKDYIRKKRVFSTTPIEENSNLSTHLKSEYTVLDYIILNKNLNNEKITEWISEYRKKYKNLIHYEKCITHSTDDLFTKTLCSKYATYLTFLAFDIGEKYKYGKISNITLRLFDNIDKPINLKIYTNEHNEKYLYRAYQITKYNKLNEFYLYDGF